VFKRVVMASTLLALGVLATGCQRAAAPAQPAAAGMQAMPVQTVTVAMQPVPQSSEYVATIKSRRSATMQPQVAGRITGILVHSGDRVHPGQSLMTLDALQQQATVNAQRATEQQKKATYDYDALQFSRQKKLYDEGIVSLDAYQQAQQALDNSKADYESASAARKTAEEQLAYFTIRAPYEGIVGDIPVHVGDYASTSTVLTTVDESGDLEAYIYVPTERVSQLRPGLEVDLMDTNDKLLEKTRIDFISPQVDSSLQGILVKAPVHLAPEKLRNQQLVKARVVWSTAPTAVVPVLAVTRLGGQPFVFLAREQGGHYIASQVSVTLGETVGNSYAVTSGLNAGDRVIVSSTQFLVNGMPVMPIPGKAGA
jgi:RND family efflux transporter MFP subunit